MARRLLSRRAPTRRRSSRFYAERFDTVELNTTGYRLPAEEQFARWARADAGRVHVRREDAADAARSRRHVRRARPARSATGSARCGSSSRAPATTGCSRSSRLAAARARGRVRLPPRVLGRRRRPRPRQRLRRGAVPLHPPARAAVLRRRSSRDRERLRCSRAGVRLYFRHEDEATAPEYAERLSEVARGQRLNLRGRGQRAWCARSAARTSPRPRDARVALGRRQVDLDEVRGRACRAVRRGSLPPTASARTSPSPCSATCAASSATSHAVGAIASGISAARSSVCPRLKSRASGAPRRVLALREERLERLRVLLREPDRAPPQATRPGRARRASSHVSNEARGHRDERGRRGGDRSAAAPDPRRDASRPARELVERLLGRSSTSIAPAPCAANVQALARGGSAARATSARRRLDASRASAASRSAISVARKAASASARSTRSSRTARRRGSSAAASTQPCGAGRRQPSNCRAAPHSMGSRSSTSRRAGAVVSSLELAAELHEAARDAARDRPGGQLEPRRRSSCSSRRGRRIGRAARARVAELRRAPPAR